MGKQRSRSRMQGSEGMPDVRLAYFSVPFNAPFFPSYIRVQKMNSVGKDPCRARSPYYLKLWVAA